MGKDDGEKLGKFVLKMVLQKYSSLWIDLTDVLVSTPYLGMAQILADFQTGSSKKSEMTKNTCYLFTSCWLISKYQSHQ